MLPVLVERVQLFLSQRAGVPRSAVQGEVSFVIDARPAAELEWLAVGEVSGLDAFQVDDVLRFIQLLQAPHCCRHGANVAGTP